MVFWVEEAVFVAPPGVPEGQMTIARCFNAGFEAHDEVPKGRLSLPASSERLKQFCRPFLSSANPVGVACL